MGETKKIIVLGAGGQLGTDTIRALKDGGFNAAGFNSAELDIRDFEKVLHAIVRERPAFVVNSAAYTNVDGAEKETERAYAVNRDGAANVARAAKETGATLVHISTDFVFDGKKSTPYGEADTVNPLSVYGKSKLAGEEKVRELINEHIIIRASWLYGATGRNFVKTMLNLAGERERLRVVSDQVGSPTWTSDLARLIVRIAGRDGAPYGIYHYSNEGVASWYDFAVAVIEEAALLGVPLKCREVEPIPTEGYPTPATRPAYSVLNKAKIRETLGLSIPHWRSSLRCMLKDLFKEKRI
ncbi:MAG: dTDP-4-dehydrorhamnose reductase [Thermodesulfobacteriota bacterium]